MRMKNFAGIVGFAIMLVLGTMWVGFAEENEQGIYSTDLPQAVQDAVDTTFKERGALTSEILDTNANFEIEVETTLSMTFVGEGAGYKNSVGYFLYDEAGEILEQHVVFDNFSGNGKGLAGGGSLNPGDTIDIGTFGAGTRVGFFLLANGFRKSNAPMWTTIKELNADGKDHDAALSLENVGTLIGFEDLKNLGDRDYNDALLLVSAVMAAVETDDVSIEEIIEAIADVDPELAETLEQTTESEDAHAQIDSEQVIAEVSEYVGVSTQEARGLLKEHGASAVQRAVAGATDADAFWAEMHGYDVVSSPIAGGGGAVGTSSMWIDFELRNPATGHVVESEFVTLTVIRVPDHVVEIVVVPYNQETRTYLFDLSTLELEAGEYELHMDFNHGPTRLMSLYVPEFS